MPPSSACLLFFLSPFFSSSPYRLISLVLSQAAAAVGRRDLVKVWQVLTHITRNYERAFESPAHVCTCGV